jgi:DNA-binding NarL/FixJ family response regulator
LTQGQPGAGGLINIIIADSHTLVRKGIRALLATQSDFNVLAEAATYEEALEQLRLHRVDVVIFDIAMPPAASGRDSLALINHVRSTQPQARTVVLTMHTENEYAARALKAGAHGYVTKDVTPETLINAIRRVVSGAMYLSPRASRCALRFRRMSPLLTKGCHGVNRLFSACWLTARPSTILHSA